MLEAFIYAINLNEIGYIGLFFLTEKIYRRRFTSGMLGKFNTKKHYLTKIRKKPKIEVLCTQQVY